MVPFMAPASKVLSEIEKYAFDQGLPIIGSKRGGILAETVRKAKPQLVLELGTLVGYSTILMGEEMDSESKIISVEKDYEEAILAKHNIKGAMLKPEIEVLVGYACDIIRGLSVCFDFIFMDADHGEFMDYLRLLEENKIKRGAVVFADNAGFYKYLMKEYLEYVRLSGLYESRYIPVNGDGVEISVKL
jgi:predicted O-methyltransferase YrrM